MQRIIDQQRRDEDKQEKNMCYEAIIESSNPLVVHGIFYQELISEYKEGRDRVPNANRAQLSIDYRVKNFIKGLFL